MMRLLLDTHVLVWAVGKSHRLPARTRDLIEDPANDILFSAASIWEIAIKAGLNRPDFRFTPRQIWQESLQAGFVERPVTSAAAIAVAHMPHHHRDPFDRLLIAQSLSEPAHLCTADAQLIAYSELVMLID